MDRLREKGVTNFASVWQSATAPVSTYQNRPFQDWYPGDEYVDWLGLSYFIYDKYVHTPFLDLARGHNKQVLIAEPEGRGQGPLQGLELSSVRIVVENTTAELKHFKALADPFRHAVDIYDDVVRAVVAVVNPRIARRVAAASALQTKVGWQGCCPTLFCIFCCYCATILF